MPVAQYLTSPLAIDRVRAVRLATNARTFPRRNDGRYGGFVEGEQVAASECQAFPGRRACKTRSAWNRVARMIALVAAMCGPVILGGGFANAAPLTATTRLTSAPGTSGFLSTASCADSWRGGTGLWYSANWSAGVPNPNTPGPVCITVPGSDVTVSALEAGVNALVVGGNSGAPVKLNIVSSDKEGGALGFSKDSQIRPTGIVDVVSGPDAKTATSSFLAQNGATLTNDGRITTSGYEGFLNPDLVNEPDGTITIDARDTHTFCCTLINYGKITVDRGAAWTYYGTKFIQSGGTFNNLGTMDVLGVTFDMTGGREMHHPIDLIGGSALDDERTAGAGSFTLTGLNTISGVIPANQRVELLSTPAVGTDTNLRSPSVTNDGTVLVEGSSGGLEGGSQLINNGTFSVMSAGPGLALAIQVTNDKGGKVHILGAGCIVNGPFTNRGTLTIAEGTDMQLNGFSFVEGGSSTLGLDVAGHGKTSKLSGQSKMSLSGTLQVTTIGSPAAGSSYTPILGVSTLTGKFANIVSPRTGYSVSYGATSVTLTAK